MMVNLFMVNSHWWVLDQSSPPLFLIIMCFTLVFISLSDLPHTSNRVSSMKATASTLFPGLYTSTRSELKDWKVMPDSGWPWLRLLGKAKGSNM